MRKCTSIMVEPLVATPRHMKTGPPDEHEDGESPRWPRQLQQHVGQHREQAAGHKVHHHRHGGVVAAHIRVSQHVAAHVCDVGAVEVVGDVRCRQQGQDAGPSLRLCLGLGVEQDLGKKALAGGMPRIPQRAVVMTGSATSRRSCLASLRHAS